MSEEYISANGDIKLLLIVGDVSKRPELVCTFYRTLSEKIGGENIVATLGNHELMFTSPDHKPDSYNQVVSWYRTMFNEFGITLLENSFMVIRPGIGISVIDMMRDPDSSHISDLVRDSVLNIFGGMGYDINSFFYGAGKKLYGDTLTCSQEIELAKKMDTSIKLMRNTIGDGPLIVLTHIPLESWSYELPNSHWVYIHGHDHVNRRIETEESRVFADGQTIKYKECYLSTAVSTELGPSFEPRDIFADTPDGIREISRWEYVDFFHNLGLDAKFSLADKVTMIVREGYKMFMFRNRRSWNILNKGSRSRTPHTPEYFYENLPEYISILIEHISDYFTELDEISKFIMMIGGDGRTDGCLVWVDEMFRVCLYPDSRMIAPCYYSHGLYECADMRELMNQVHPDIRRAYLDNEKEWSVRMPKMYDDCWRDNRYHNVHKMTSTFNKYRRYRMMWRWKVISEWDLDTTKLSDEPVRSDSILSKLNK